MTAKPAAFLNIWANAGDVLDPAIGQKDSGWSPVGIIPTRQITNWLQNVAQNWMQHVNEQGIPVWDLGTTYPVDGIAKGTDGILYKATVLNVNEDPTGGANPNWVALFAGGGGGDIKSDGTVPWVANQSMGSNRLTTMADPTAAQDAATKNYVDTADNLRTKIDGSTPFTGDQSMGTNKLTDVVDPAAAQDAATKAYVDALLGSNHFSAEYNGADLVLGASTWELIPLNQVVASHASFGNVAGVITIQPGTYRVISMNGYLDWSGAGADFDGSLRLQQTTGGAVTRRESGQNVDISDQPNSVHLIDNVWSAPFTIGSAQDFEFQVEATTGSVELVTIGPEKAGITIQKIG